MALDNGEVSVVDKPAPAPQGKRTLRQWVKAQESPLARTIYRTARATRGFQMPLIKPIHLPLYYISNIISSALSETYRIFWSTPLFQARLTKPAPGLYLTSGIPQLLGNLAIDMGPDCRVSGVTTLMGRVHASQQPVLKVGRNCDISWQTVIAVGTKVELGDNVIISSRCFLAGFPGHPVDPVERAKGAACLDEQSGDIVLEDSVWIATGVTVMKGVRIGRGTIVAAGSVVIKDLPPGVIAAGKPAKPIRAIEAADRQAFNS